MQNINEWRKEIAEKYSTIVSCVVPANSMSAWGYHATREHLGNETSPFGGKYKVYSSQTLAEKSKMLAK